MYLKIIGSNSKGNGYLLEGSTCSLLVEAGMPFADFNKMHSLPLSKLAGCIVTHEHGDHAKFSHQYVKKGVQIYASNGTLNAIGVNGTALEPYKRKTIGEFTVLPFQVKHDAAEPFGFIISHSDFGNMLFVTDTMYVEHRFKNLNQIMIEANYDNETLDNCASIEHAMRVRNSHMSIQHCIDTLKRNDLSSVMNVILIHLSEENADEEDFRRRIHESDIIAQVHVAKKKLEVLLSDLPF